MSGRCERAESRPGNQPANPQADVVLHSQQSVETTTSWTGPIPPPDVLERYEATLPGAADRIMSMAEMQLAHRIQLEKKVVGGDSSRSYLGLAAAFVLSLVAICGSILVIVQGHVWAGVTIFGIDIVALAGIFVYGTQVRRAERESKAEKMPQIRK